MVQDFENVEGRDGEGNGSLEGGKERGLRGTDGGDGLVFQWW